MVGRSPSVSTKEVIRQFALHPDPVLSPSEINDDLGMSVEGTRKRLMSIVDDGYLRTKKVGAKGRVFWVSDEGKELLQSEAP